MIDHAIMYHRLGWSVIPIQPGDKRPLIKWEGYQRRRATEEEIKSWWGEWPEANVGIVTGAVSGLVVLDSDGTEAKESLVGKHMPTTPVAYTGKGEHHYYRHPGGSIRCWTRKLPGLDLKADGGYVVVPPSVHPTGAVYEWAVPVEDTDDLADLPVWLLKLCGHKAKTLIAHEDEEAWYEQALGGVKTGERNDMAAKLAGRYLGSGLSVRETLTIMATWNKQNKPPMDEKELTRTVESIGKREQSKRASESIVQGEDIDLDGMEETERREIMLSALQEALNGVKIHRVIKYLSERPTYELETSAGSIKLGEADNLINQAKFRIRITELENKYLKPFKPKIWDQIAESLVALVEEIEVSSEATASGQLIGWLRAYLEITRPMEEDIEVAITSKRPFISHGVVHIFLPSLLRFITLSQMEHGITIKDLAVRLKGIGGSSELERFGKKVCRCWELPDLEEEP